MYIIKSGEVQILRKIDNEEDVVLAHAGKNSLFGEVSYFLQQHPKSSVVAVSDCQYYKLPGKYIDGQFEQNKTFGAEFMEFCCQVLFERNMKATTALKDRERVEENTSDN